MPLGFPPEGFRSGLRYRAKPGDIFIAAYPKCGTTWVQHIVFLLLREGRPLPPGRRLSDEIPHLEEVGAAAVELRPPPRAIKTHLPFSMTPYHAAAKYIYVARNPFDCAVSFYHHTRGFPRHYDFLDGTFDDYFECFIAGEVDFGDYFGNLLPWCDHRDDANVLFLTYEQIKRAHRAAVEVIGAFIGGNAAASALDPQIVEGIVRATSFAGMRRDQQRWTSRRPPGMPFVRKGVVGDWQRHFSAEQARRLAARFAAETAGTPAAGLWSDIVEAAARHAVAAPLPEAGPGRR